MADNDFAEYRRLLLQELTRLDTAHKELFEKLNQLEKDLAIVSTKVLIYASIASIVMSFILKEFLK